MKTEQQVDNGPAPKETTQAGDDESVKASSADANEDGVATADDPPEDPLAEAEKRAAALKDQLLRTAADFDNYRKRSRREVDDARLGGRESMLKELLPVFDNLERATAAADGATDIGAFANGIEMVMRQFHDTLKKLGVERVPSVGQPFDPSVHEAIQQIESADVAPGHIAAEIQGGYRAGERLIRPAMVVVAASRQNDDASAEESGDAAEES